MIYSIDSIHRIMILTKRFDFFDVIFIFFKMYKYPRLDTAFMYISLVLYLFYILFVLNLVLLIKYKI